MHLVTVLDRLTNVGVSSVHVTATARYNSSALSRAADMQITYDPKASVISRALDGGMREPYSGDGWSTFSQSAWWDVPARWRDDTVDSLGARDSVIVTPEGTTVVLGALNRRFVERSSRPSDGKHATMRLPTLARRIEGFPLALPTTFTRSWTVSGATEGELLGRRTDRVVASRASPDWDQLHDAEDPNSFWSGIDDYNWQIDVETGLLLRFAGSFDSQEVASITVDCFSLNEPADQSIFDDTLLQQSE